MSKSNLKILFLTLGSFLVIHLFTYSTGNSDNQQNQFLNEFVSLDVVHKATDIQVYICKGPASKRYHYTKTCRGLNSCSTKIYKVSLSEAEELGRTLCGWED